MKRAFERPLLLAAAVLAVLACAAAPAQEYPAKPVRIIIGFPPGGATDLVSRLMAPKYAAIFKQQFIVDNRGGSNGLIGAEVVARSPSDGYTIMFHSIMYAIWTRAKTPQEIVARLHGAIVKVIHSPEYKQRLEREGASEPIGNSPEQMAATIRADMEKLAKLVKAAGIQPQ